MATEYGIVACRLNGAGVKPEPVVWPLLLMVVNSPEIAVPVGVCAFTVKVYDGIAALSVKVAVLK